jgi:serine protease Do
MYRIVFRHLSGSRGQSADEIPLAAARDILIGREPTAQVRFDADRDDLVGRQHARILQDPTDQFRFSVVDLNSRNGTFVNRQRVVGPATLTPGDIVQLGPGGPEFQFDIDPLPPNVVRATRLAASASGPMPPTREASTVISPVPGNVGREPARPFVAGARAQSKPIPWMMIGAAAVVVLAVAGGLVWRSRTTGPGGGPNPEGPIWPPAQIAAEFSSSTVAVEFAWKLVFAGTGEQIYQRYEPVTERKGNPMDAPAFLARRESTGEEKFVPLLTTSAGARQQNHAIACGGTGSGFVVTTDGTIMTNRHVAANWEARFMCFPDGPAKIYRQNGEQLQFVADVPDIRALRLDWVPAKDGRLISGKRFSGENIFLDVVFKLNKLRFPASVAVVSDRADVSLIKVTVSEPLKKVDLYNNYDTMAVGNTVTVMGYPAVSPSTVVATASLDPMSREQRTATIPDPTVTPGSVGRIFRQNLTSEGTRIADTGFGDTYQLTVNSTGSGNSGGPVFDDRGRVIGLFTYGLFDQAGTAVSAAVPIRYGLELMSVRPTVSAGKGP